jgi:transposase
MITYNLFCQIQQYHHQEHLSAGQIAGILNLNEKTVLAWAQRTTYRKRQTTKRKSILDPYKELIVQLLERHPYSAAQILQRLREQGYQGGYTILKSFIQIVRPKRQKAFLTLSWRPGECAQVDWGSFGSTSVSGTKRRLSFFVMALCYSRLLYCEFTLEHFLACHQHAFDFFGGVPAAIMVDNLKAAVLKRPPGEQPVINPRYLDFANHYGFTIRPCGVRKPHEKGAVEAAVGYIKKNFLNGLDISTFAPINPAAMTWLNTVANVRIHGETHHRPVDVPMPYDVGIIRPGRSTNRFRVPFDSNRYSVPAEYASQSLILKAYPDQLCIYHHDNLIALHPRSYGHHLDFENPDHVKSLLAERLKARKPLLLKRFLLLTPKAEEYYQHLQQRRLNADHHIQKIVALCEIYGQDRVARALEDAFVFQAYSCEYIANILEQRERRLPEPGALHLTRRQDLLELDMPEPDLSVYDQQPRKQDAHE